MRKQDEWAMYFLDAGAALNTKAEMSIRLAEHCRQMAKTAAQLEDDELEQGLEMCQGAARHLESALGERLVGHG